MINKMIEDIYSVHDSLKPIVRDTLGIEQDIKLVFDYVELEASGYVRIVPEVVKDVLDKSRVIDFELEHKLAKVHMCPFGLEATLRELSRPETFLSVYKYTLLHEYRHVWQALYNKPLLLQQLQEKLDARHTLSYKPLGEYIAEQEADNWALTQASNELERLVFDFLIVCHRTVRYSLFGRAERNRILQEISTLLDSR